MAKALTNRILKATSLLGSSQFLAMACSAVRMKLLSLWLGPIGVALMGVLMQVIDLISNLTQLNIRTSAVRDLASAPAEARPAVIVVVRKVSRALGMVGVLLMLLLAPWLSRWTLHTTQFAPAFRIASLTLIFQALQGGESIILQADARYKSIAASGLTAALTGLLIAIPLFLLLGIDGVAPAVVTYALSSWLASLWFTRRLRPDEAAMRLKLRECFRRASGFIKVGMYMVIATLFSNLTSLILVSYLRRYGIDDLGLYQAGNTMLLRYVGVVLMAIGLDLYPRLSAAASSPRRMHLLMTHYAAVHSTYFFPCVLLASIIAPWLIRLLYTAEFLPMLPYFRYGLVGMYIKPVTLILSYVLLATGSGRTYCATEIIVAAATLLCSIAGYHLDGFRGLGIGFTISVLIDLVVMLTACRLHHLPVIKTRTIAAILAAALLFQLFLFFS